MADTSFAVTAGSGTDLHTVTTAIGGTTVHDQVVKQGEPYLATYTVTAINISLATAASHVLQIMAGSTLNVYLRRLWICQKATATTASIVGLALSRLTTAGTGGGAVTLRPLNTTDAAAGATAMTLPTVKGTTAYDMAFWTAQVIQTVGTGGSGDNTVLLDLDFDAMRTKPPRIPAGTANGLAIANVDAVAAATVYVTALISEANF